MTPAPARQAGVFAIQTPDTNGENHDQEIPEKRLAKDDPDKWRKLNIKDGVIHYRLYAQDGSMINMTVRDDLNSRMWVEYIQRHDRYTNGD